MRSQDDHNKKKGPRRRGGRTVVRLDTAALWERLTLLNRSQNWLAREVGVSPGVLKVPPQPLGLPYPGAEIYNLYPDWAMNREIQPRP